MASTHLTPAQRARKIAAARKRMQEAQKLLAEVADDMSARSFMLTETERREWGTAVHTLTNLDKAVAESDAFGGQQ